MCFKIEKAEVEFIQKGIEILVQKIATELFETKDIPVIKVGSFYEGTKNHFPDEFDFIVIPSGIAEIYAHHIERKLEILISKNKTSLKYTAHESTSQRTIYIDHYVGVHGPAYKLQFSYINIDGFSTNRHKLHADLVPADRIILAERGTDMCRRFNNIKVQQFRRLIKSAVRCRLVRSNYSFTETEVKFMQEELSEKHRKVYRILKHLINGRGDFEKLKDYLLPLQQMDKNGHLVIRLRGYSSYMIKTMMIYHHYDCTNTDEECLGPCMLHVLNEMCKYTTYSPFGRPEELGNTFPVLVEREEHNVPVKDLHNLCLQPFLKLMTDHLHFMQSQKQCYSFEHGMLKKSVSKVYMDTENHVDKIANPIRFQRRTRIPTWISGSALAKFRSGVAPIRVETGRYERLNLNDRVCPICKNGIEDEMHVLLYCPQYTDVRQFLFEKAVDACIMFNTLNDINKLCFILSDERMVKITAKSCSDILKIRRDCLYLTN